MYRVEIDGTKLKVYSDGTIYRKMKSDNWKEIDNKANHIKGYNVILINKKQYMRAKIIAFAFLDKDLYDTTFFVCHKDTNKLNCDENNLFIKHKK
jgi:hypothetical protein